jgi:DNA-binding NarL/FixJ family response regulator
MEGVSRLVLVAAEDEHERGELAQLLEETGFSVVHAATGEEALATARTGFPNLALLGVVLDGMSGYEVCRTLREEDSSDLPIIFVSGSRTESADCVAGLTLGADDYVVKPYAADELLARIRRLIERSRPQRVVVSRLTPREHEVLRLLAEGSSPDEIARQLFISPRTVATHIDHILSKLNVKSRVQAVAVAYRDGLVELPV